MGLSSSSLTTRAILAFTTAATSCFAGCVPLTDSTELGVPGRAHVSYAAGRKVKESAWSPGEREHVFGFVDADRRLAALPAWVVGKALVGTADAPEGSADPDADSAGTAELCVGLRKYLQVGRAELFGSAGVALLSGGITGYREEAGDAYSIADETALGGWVDLGLQVPVTRAFVVGIVLHHSAGEEIELEGVEVQPGGTSLLLTLGWRR